MKVECVIKHDSKPLQIWQNDGILCIMIKFVKGSLGIWYQEIQGIEKANV